MEFFRAILYLPPGASAWADELDRLHVFVITITMLGALIVALFALVFIVRYRRRGAAKPTPEIGASLQFEIAAFGGLLLLFVVWWIIGFVQYIRIQTPPREALEVYVTGKQWMWKFAYPDGQRSAGVLVVPRGRPVKLILSSRDVIHSFFVPAFRIKRDALPERYTAIWFTATQSGRFPAYCAEYCGLSHSRMWADVVVLEPLEYEMWLEGDTPRLVAQAAANASIAEGRYGEEEVMTMAERGLEASVRYGCFSCHTVDGQPHIGPTWLGLFGSTRTLDDETSVVADESYLTRSMMDPQVEIVAGFKPVMPTYRGTLDPTDAAAIIAFIKTLREDGPPPVVRLPEVRPLEPGVPIDAGVPAVEEGPGPLLPVRGLERDNPGGRERDASLREAPESPMDRGSGS